MFRRRLIQSVSGTIIVGLIAHLIVAPVDTVAAGVRTVAISGLAAPGTSTGTTYDSFRTPVINDAGRTAFGASLEGESVDDTNRRGIWSEGLGSLQMVARQGSSAPNLPENVTFGGFSNLLLSGNGRTAFTATFFSGGSMVGQGLLSQRFGSLIVVAHTGEQLPGGVDFTAFLDPIRLNDADQVAFSAFYAPNNSGVWSEGSGALQPIALHGTEVPDAAGAKFNLPLRPLLNDVGQTAFSAFLANGGVGNDGAIWVDTAGTLRRVARVGDPAPDLPDSFTFFSLNSESLALNNAGQTAFLAKVRDNAGPLDDGIWSEGSGTLRRVAGDDSEAPGMPDGVFFFSFGSPVLNDQGKVAFTARFSDSPAESNRGVWSEGSGTLALVARSGDPAPGTSPGVVFRNTSTNTLFSDLVLNDAGQIAFTAVLSGDGVTSNNNFGIWATDRNGNLQLIVRAGDLFELGPGDSRTISGLSFSGGAGNSDGRPSGFNNYGQLAFRALFTDGTDGVFVSNVVVVPEPAASSFAILAIWGFFAVVPGRKSRNKSGFQTRSPASAARPRRTECVPRRCRPIGISLCDNWHADRRRSRMRAAECRISSWSSVGMERPNELAGATSVSPLNTWTRFRA